MRKKSAILIIHVFVLGVFLIGCSTAKETETANGEVNLTVELDKDMFQTGDEITFTYEHLQLIDVDVEFNTSDTLKEFGRISTKQALMMDGEENLLYCTFDDPDYAFDTLIENYGDVLEQMRKKYYLFKISKNNWHGYRDVANDFRESNPESEEEHDRRMAVQQFFDIYEGEELNDEIIKLFDDCKAKKLKPEEGIDLILALPYTCPAYEKYCEYAFPNKPKPEHDIEEK